MESSCLVLSQLMHVQQDEPHSGAPLLQRQAESVGVVRPRKEKVLGRPHFSLPIPKGGLPERRGGTLSGSECTDRTGGNVFKYSMIE